MLNHISLALNAAVKAGAYKQAAALLVAQSEGKNSLRDALFISMTVAWDWPPIVHLSDCTPVLSS